MMRALAAFIVAGPLQAVVVIALFTALSLLVPPLIYGGAAALALYSLHAGARRGVIVLLGAMLVTGLLTEMLLHQGLTIAVTLFLLWISVWLAAVVLRESRSLAMAMLALSVLAMIAILLTYAWFGDLSQRWLEFLQGLINSLASQPESRIDSELWMEVAEQAAPFMTGSLAASLSLAVMICLVLGRWWQSLIVKPGALRKEFYALRLNKMLSLLAVAIFAVAALKLGGVSALALQWSLVVMVPFLFVGLAVVHATLVNLKAARIWLIIIYVLMSFSPQVMILVIATGILDPWLDLRRRTEKSENI